MEAILIQDFNDRAEIKKKTAKPLLWIAIVSIIMLFSGWTSAVIVTKAANTKWVEIEMPIAFTISTLIIILSSLVYQFGLVSIKKDHKKIFKLTALLTLVLGILFVVSQFFGWKELYTNGIVATGPSSSNASSFLYIITLFHVLHLLAGIISLIVVSVKSFREKYSSTNFLGIEISLIYWHFLGILWIYLFFFLKYVA